MSRDFFLTLCFFSLACNSATMKNVEQPDRSLVLGKRTENVQNGTAYDKAVVDIHQVRKLIVPDTATVRTEGEDPRIRVYLKKVLAFVGHPPAPMSITEARKNMGCATRHEKMALELATFGEWNSHKEGSAYISILVIVPKGMEVEKRSGLAGEKSSARQWRKGEEGKENERINGYWWYGPPYPADGWTSVTTTSDPDRTAE